ncbi:diguanylate cyclase domain-containing protein [Acetobacterium sp.]|uniref:diguanylate cyclase domain-containing protein n=1 Tax=Acetobacterium sp. TaxID=1872094 RepID=UPI002F3E4918
MLGWDTIQTMLFTILCICFIFYLLMGISNLKRENRSKSNTIFFVICISTSFWAIGYAFMLISPNVEIANSWRIISALGWCFFNALWLSFALSLNDANQKNATSKMRYALYIISTIFFISNLMFEPSQVVSHEVYGFVDNLYTMTPIGTVFSIYNVLIMAISIVIIYFKMRKAHKNRIKKQIKIILITSLISVALALTTDLFLPPMGIMIFPSGIITLTVGMGGIWYAINKYKMMSISWELVSEYLFEAVNEPIFILGEDFLVKNCNKAALSITGFYDKDLKENSLDTIINFRNYNFNSIMQTGNVTSIEVDLHRGHKEALVCELSATVIQDEYKDILGILALLHDVSERKMIAEIQEKYTLKLEETNLKLKNEIVERLLAEDQIRHFIYYDALTELFNRKKMLEDLESLLDDKNEKFAVLFIDLDHFKSVNDHYGHEAGDLILKMVAVRLKSIIRSTDTISRMGGDEFIIILRNLKDIVNAEKFAGDVLKTLSTAFTYKENQLLIGASIGISLFPEHGFEADMLINKADSAMYEAKRQGGNGYKIYSSEMKED